MQASDIQRSIYQNNILHILIVNSVPLIGVLFFNWNVGEIVIVFWLQSFFIGIFNLLKMGMAKGSNIGSSKIGTMAFFTFHYFFFIFGQAFFMFIFVLGKSDIHNAINLNYPVIFSGITLSLGYTFINEYILSGEYLRRSAESYFFSPYGRVFVQQILVLGTAFMVSKYQMDQQTAIIFLIVGLKLIADLAQLFLTRLINKNQEKTTPQAG